MLQWTPELDAGRYSAKIWEKWIHAAYFGQVFYWLDGLNVVSYHFEDCLTAVPMKSWYRADGRRVTARGYFKRLKRHRKPVRGKTLNLAQDFEPKQRYWWEGGGFKVPDAKLFIAKRKHQDVSTNDWSAAGAV